MFAKALYGKTQVDNIWNFAYYKSIESYSERGLEMKPKRASKLSITPWLISAVTWLLTICQGFYHGYTEVGTLILHVVGFATSIAATVYQIKDYRLYKKEQTPPDDK